MMRLKKSFFWAIEGVVEAFKREPNFKIQLIIALVVLLLGVLANISAWKWAILLITVAFVLSFELVNTACEKMLDILIKEHHPSIKYVKDILAGAVLILSIMAILIAIIVFLI